MYTESLEVYHSNVIPTEEPLIIFLNEVSLLVTKDDEFVDLHP